MGETQSSERGFSPVCIDSRSWKEEEIKETTEEGAYPGAPDLHQDTSVEGYTDLQLELSMVEISR